MVRPWVVVIALCKQPDARTSFVMFPVTLQVLSFETFARHLECNLEQRKVLKQELDEAT